MLVPLRTNRPLKRRPLVTEGLVVVNTLVYVAIVLGNREGLTAAMLDHGMLRPFTDEAFNALQFISYQFLHDPSSIWHVAFNMLFLWVFGSPVEDQMGRAPFAVFYLLGGAVSGMAHLLAVDVAVIGASGSVACVSGSFLALFPRSRIKVLLIFFIIGVYVVPSMWFILFYFAVDIMRQTRDFLGGQDSGVAYMAHIAGYGWGFGCALLLLLAGRVPRGEFDVLFLFAQSRRRASYRQSLAVPKKKVPNTAPSMRSRSVASSSAEIRTLLAARQLDKASDRYVDVCESENIRLEKDLLLLIGNNLQSRSKWLAASAAYEKYLIGDGNEHESSALHLLLASNYIRRLNRPVEARSHIEKASEHIDSLEHAPLLKELSVELSHMENGDDGK